MLLVALEVVLEDRFVILTTVEHADDGDLLGFHVEGDHGALLVVCDAHGAAMKENSVNSRNSSR
jgi:hypothetical protein